MAILWQFHTIRFDNHTEISGIILNKMPPQLSESPLTNALRVLSTYYVNPVVEKTVQVCWEGESLHVATDKTGKFSGQTSADIPPLLEVIVDGKPLQLPTDYPFQFHDAHSPVGIISDIDDTVIQSYSAHHLRRVRTTLFATTERRKSVPFIQSLYGYIAERACPVFYVSKSESNLFRVLTSVFEQMDLPAGPLMLTPYLRFSGLFRSKPADHKIEHISRIMDGYAHRRFILFGDDSQKDMIVYRKVIDKYPERILRVFIRSTVLRMNVRKTKEFQELKDTGVPVVYFEDDQDPTSELAILAELL